MYKEQDMQAFPYPTNYCISPAFLPERLVKIHLLQKTEINMPRISGVKVFRGE